MNTIDINITKKHALQKGKGILTSVEIFLLKKGVKLNDIEKGVLHEEISQHLQRINFAIEE